MLTTNSPPKEAQAIPRPIHQTGVIGDVHYEIDVTPSPSGNILFDLRLTDAEGRPVAVSPPEMDLTMPEHLMPPYYTTMQRVSSGRYQADLILPMSGRWVIYIQSERDGIPLDDIVLDFRSAASSRDQQREWYVSYWRAVRWPIGPMVTAVWIGLVVLAVFAIRHGRRKEEFKPLLVSGSLLLFFSVWQVGSLFVGEGVSDGVYAEPGAAHRGSGGGGPGAVHGQLRHVSRSGRPRRRSAPRRDVAAAVAVDDPRAVAPGRGDLLVPHERRGRHGYAGFRADAHRRGTVDHYSLLAHAAS